MWQVVPGQNHSPGTQHTFLEPFSNTWNPPVQPIPEHIPEPPAVRWPTQNQGVQNLLEELQGNCWSVSGSDPVLFCVAAHGPYIQIIEEPKQVSPTCNKQNLLVLVLSEPRPVVRFQNLLQPLVQQNNSDLVNQNLCNEETGRRTFWLFDL